MTWKNLHADLLEEFAERSVFVLDDAARFFTYGEKERTAAREGMRRLRARRVQEGYYKSHGEWVFGVRPTPPQSKLSQRRERGATRRRDQAERWAKATELFKAGVPALRVSILCKMSQKNAIGLRNSLGIAPNPRK